MYRRREDINTGNYVFPLERNEIIKKPKSVIAVHKFSLYKYPWSLSSMQSLFLVLFDLLVTNTEAFSQLFAPATLSFYFHGPLLPQPNSQFQSSKRLYLPFPAQVLCFLLLDFCSCKPFPLTCKMPSFLFNRRPVFAFVQNVSSLILSLHNLLAWSNSKISACL